MTDTTRELSLLRTSADLVQACSTGPFDRDVAELLRAVADDVEANPDTWNLARISAIRLAKTFMGIDRSEEVPRGSW